jgi:ribosomal protein S18 acetylase RimI-like enzyme
MHSNAARQVDLVIRRATPADAARLADLAARTFHDTFAADNQTQAMAVHLARSYAPAVQLEEINRPDMRTLLVEIGGESIAYAQLRSEDDDTPTCVTGPNPIEVFRFYVDRPWIGRGVAQPLMCAAIDEGRSLGAKTLWLGVWERNSRAIAFYTKCGFTLVGDHEFLFADEVQTDLVMVRPI